jgi:hypothetical protein
VSLLFPYGVAVGVGNGEVLTDGDGLGEIDALGVGVITVVFG